MRASVLMAAFVTIQLASGCASTRGATAGRTSRALSRQLVKAGCGTCVFRMEGVVGCKLAVRIDGMPYLVTGSDIDDHGDAHAANGLCNSARTALVDGTLDGDRFVARHFELRSVSDVDAIYELFRKRVAAGNSGNVAAWVGLFTNDAVIMPANGPTITGKQAIREWEQKFADAFTAHGEISPTEIVTSGDWAFVRTKTTATITSRDGKPPIQIDGKELCILRRQPDGMWKIARLIGNSNAPPTSPKIKAP